MLSKAFFTFLVGFFFLLPVIPALAQTFPDPGFPDSLAPRCEGFFDSPGKSLPGCSLCHFVGWAQGIFQLLINLAVFIAVGMIVYAGFLYLFSQGDMGKVKKAHQIFLNVVIGIIVVLLAWFAVDFIAKFFIAKDMEQEFGPWNAIECSLPEDRVYQDWKKNSSPTGTVEVGGIDEDLLDWVPPTAPVDLGDCPTELGDTDFPECVQ